MPLRLKRIGPLFFARLLSLVMAGYGLAAGCLYAFGGLLHDLIVTRSLNAGTALAFLALAGMPALFAAAGFAAGCLGAPIYNGWARLRGGIMLDIDTE